MALPLVDDGAEQRMREIEAEYTEFLDDTVSELQVCNLELAGNERCAVYHQHLAKIESYCDARITHSHALTTTCTTTLC